MLHIACHSKSTKLKSSPLLDKSRIHLYPTKHNTVEESTRSPFWSGPLGWLDMSITLTSKTQKWIVIVLIPQQHLSRNKNNKVHFPVLDVSLIDSYLPYHMVQISTLPHGADHSGLLLFWLFNSDKIIEIYAHYQLYNYMCLTVLLNKHNFLCIWQVSACPVSACPVSAYSFSRSTATHWPQLWWPLALICGYYRAVCKHILSITDFILLIQY